MSYEPACVKPGVQSNTAVPLPLSVSVAPVGRAVEVKTGNVESGSVADRPRLRLTPSVTIWLPMAARVTGWLPASSTVMATISESTPSVSSVARKARL